MAPVANATASTGTKAFRLSAAASNSSTGTSARRVAVNALGKLWGENVSCSALDMRGYFREGSPAQRKARAGVPARGT